MAKQKEATASALQALVGPTVTIQLKQFVQEKQNETGFHISYPSAVRFLLKFYNEHKPA